MTYETSGHGQDAAGEVSRHLNEDVHDLEQPPDLSSWKTIDMEREGADQTGNDPINSVVNDAIAEGVRLHFPEGVYLVDGVLFDNSQNIEKVAFTGTNATFKVASGIDYELIDATINQFVWRGIDWNIQNAPQSRPMTVGVYELGDVSNVELNGEFEENSTYRPFTLGATGDDGTMYVRNLRAMDGDVNGNAYACLYLSGGHTGTNVIKNPAIANFGGTAIQASYNQGLVIIDGGYFYNNGRGMRLGNRVHVRNPTIVAEGTNTTKQGMRINDRNYETNESIDEAANVIVEGADITIDGEPTEPSAKGITVRGSVEQVTIRNSKIRHHGGGNALELRTDFEDAVRVENVKIEDTTDEVDAEDSYTVNAHPTYGAVFDSCDIDAPDRWGVRLGRDTAVRDCGITARNRCIGTYITTEDHSGNTVHGIEKMDANTGDEFYLGTGPVARLNGDPTDFTISGPDIPRIINGIGDSQVGDPSGSTNWNELAYDGLLVSWGSGSLSMYRDGTWVVVS